MGVYIFLLIVLLFLSFIDKNGILPNIIFSKKIKIRGKYIFKNNMNYDIKKFNIAFSLAVLIIFCFTAFRYNVGWDYKAYYNTIRYNAVTNIMSNREYLNIFLIELSRKLNITNIYFSVNALVLVVLFAKTIKGYSKDIWLSLMIFITFPLFYLNSLSVIRMFSALAITFYAFKYLIENKPFRYVTAIVLASMFHKSAIIAISFYFLKHIKFKRYKLVITLGMLPFLSNLINSIVIDYFPRYSAYTAFTDGQEGTKAILIFISIGVLSLILRDKIVKDSVATNIYYNLFYIGLFIYLMFFKQGTMGHRLSLYGTIYSILLVPDLISLVKNPRYAIVLKWLVYIICIVFFLYTINMGAETYIPYKTIWSIF